MSYNSRFQFIIFLFAAMFFACQKPARDNPWDEQAQIDPEEWAPKQVTLQRKNITQNSLSWNYNDRNIQGFRIDRKRGDETWSEGYVSLPKTARSWYDTLIQPDTTHIYQYRVYAYAGSIASANTELTFKPVFEAPTNLLIEKLNEISYALSWQNNTQWAQDAGLNQGLKVDRKRGNENWEIGYAVLPPATEQWADTNVFAQRDSLEMQYRLYGFYESYASNAVLISTKASLNDPTFFQLQRVNIDQVNLFWQGNNQKADGFIIARSTDEVVWEELGRTTKTNWIDSTFSFYGVYHYRVCAYKGNYISNYVTASFDALLPVPLGINLFRNNITSVSLFWQEPITGIEGYRIKRKVGNGNWEVISESEETGFVDIDFPLNEQIFYEINCLFEDAESEPAAIEFDSNIPPPVITEINRVNLGMITLSWQGTINGQDSYRIERKTSDADWMIIQDNLESSLTDINFPLNTYISYRICTVYGELNSDYVITGFDANIAPIANFEVSNNEAGLVNLSWSYSYNGHEGYLLERKIDDGSWDSNFSPLLNAETTSYNDADVNLDEAVYNYRIRVSVRGYLSEPATVVITKKCGYPFIDVRDGRTYNTVEIGNQCWMAENLSYLPYVMSSDNGSFYQHRYYVYGYQGAFVADAINTDNFQNYGVLYNFTAASSACPEGWALPEINEWELLVQQLAGGAESGGQILKSCRQPNSPLGGECTTEAHPRWNIYENIHGTDAFGFGLIPGGSRTDNGDFTSLGNYGYYWSATGDNAPSNPKTLLKLFYYNSDGIGEDYGFNQRGFSVRCIKQ